MDPINPLNSLAELLRKRITSEATAMREERTSGGRRVAGQACGPRRVDVAVLRNRITDTIKAIDPDDPARNRKGLTVFVESVLVWQFGNDVLNDPRFADLLVEVQRTLENDPAVTDLLTSVIGGR